MNVALSIVGWIADSLAYMTELIVYGLRAIWVTAVQATISFLDALDDLLPDLDIPHNALWRALIMAGVGFLLGVGLMIFLSFMAGMWFIPCAFIFAILACAVMGLVADPDMDWSVGPLPTFGRRGDGPQTPLNL